MSLHVRNVQRKSGPTDNLRVLLGFRPDYVKVTSRPETTAVVSIVENYDGNDLDAAGAGGWLVAGGAAPASLTAAAGIIIENEGIVLGSAGALRVNKGWLLIEAWQADTVDEIDLEDEDVGVIDADALGAGAFTHDATKTPPLPVWIGTTS